MQFVISRHQGKHARHPHYYMGIKGMWSPHLRDAEFYIALPDANAMLRVVKGHFTTGEPPRALKVIGVDDEQANAAKHERAQLAERNRARVEGGRGAD